VVNGYFFQLRILPGQNLFQFAGITRNLEPSLACLVHFMLMLLQSLRYRDKGPNKHSRVPAVLSAVEIFQGFVEVRFFHELLSPVENGFVAFDSCRSWKGLADANVTVTSRWLGRFDADGDNGLTT